MHQLAILPLLLQLDVQRVVQLAQLFESGTKQISGQQQPELILTYACTSGVRYQPFFTQSMRIKLASPQAAWLNIFL